jgi:hypothetical protein
LGAEATALASKQACNANKLKQSEKQKVRMVFINLMLNQIHQQEKNKLKGQQQRCHRIAVRTAYAFLIQQT